MVNRILLLVSVGIPILFLTLLSTNGQHTVSAQASNATVHMTNYSDSMGRFSISYPSNWTVEPATNRFESPQVTFNSGAGVDANVVIVGSGSDPEALSRQFAITGPFGFTLFQDVECTKYKVEGQKACSVIFTKQADPNLGTQGVVVMTVVSYVNGQMYSLNFGAGPNVFDSTLPTFEAMLNSFKAGR